jgi:hypothetical protein
MRKSVKVEIYEDRLAAVKVTPRIDAAAPGAAEKGSAR